MPQQPDWLPASAAEGWVSVLSDLEAAGVPLQRIDGHAVAFYLICIDGAKKAAQEDDAKMLARFSRDAISWGNLIGATPAARCRMSIKGPEPDDARDLAEILNQPRPRSAVQ